MDVNVVWMVIAIIALVSLILYRAYRHYNRIPEGVLYIGNERQDPFLLTPEQIDEHCRNFGRGPAEGKTEFPQQKPGEHLQHVNRFGTNGDKTNTFFTGSELGNVKDIRQHQSFMASTDGAMSASDEPVIVRDDKHRDRNV